MPSRHCLGAVAACVCYRLHVLQVPEQIACAALVFVIRVVALRRGWSAPIAHP